MLSMA